MNLNRNQQATESALQLAIKFEIDLLLIQEPWIIEGETTRLTLHPNFNQILPNFGE